ncbi:peptide deformylase [Lactobacillus delbrueckii subsp. lactis]|jgi:peptide deformylase|uniref:Peptide deformylase n=2 Tax=Lactobacillus delbrueckii TaxID=1584 RepID=A0A1L3JYC4_LACDL|nr:peptide deformylase [Lactobacillus delbrueckii]APG70117.1 peptide deformylase [Lactobacillus delbrueckii subsp. lactis]ASW11052.1 peptide deformylase [Lactobacillus delbrueckii subsp. lactis DSM 20072]ASW63084.1 peptide deformylase [Lactobacillus delbrueckii subsp. lactis]AZA16956.1 MAG: peptide deformylase [Lactobacillus delbrueckii subsp. lactis]AZA24494.1 MAG: peptide deformylase [Lactobacillus delbrueckii subsp. lactis]
MTVQKIIHDPLSLSQPAAKAAASDRQAAQDLLDTLLAHRESIDGLPPAAGLAANMIGVNKAIIAVNAGFLPIVMLNPKIVKGSGHYLAEEGCLSLPGERPADRYEEITVKYQDMDLKEHEQAFTGFVAETIQHEVDHCKGKLI